jgi:ABC-type nitrate/sulfonate/bicarbonate transport system substrate-binding protein
MPDNDRSGVLRSSAELATIIASSFRPTLPIVLAQAGGQFRRAGLAVELRTPASSGAQLRQLIDGEIDVAHTALDNIVAWSAEAEVRIIGVTDLGVAHELVARDPITTVAALRGRTIGVDSPRSGFVVLLEAVLRDAGLSSDDYTIVPVGGLSGRTAALSAGEIDASLLAGAGLTAARAAGHHRLLALRDHFPKYPAIALVAHARTIATREADLRSYVGALCQGLREDEAELDAVAAILGIDTASARVWINSERTRITGTIADAEAAATAIADGLAVTGRGAPGGSLDGFSELLMDDRRGADELYTFSRAREETG